MQSMWVDTGDGELYVEVAGSGQPIVLIHGWPLDHRMFAPQVAALSKYFTVITYDRRGFGKSKAKPDLRLELDDIDSIMDALGAPMAHVLGMSQGGRIALRYAAARPERIRSLLLQGAVVDGFDVAGHDDEHVPVTEYAELARRGELQEVLSRWLQHPMMWLGDEHKNEQRLLRTILRDYAGSDLIDYDAESYTHSMDVLATLANFAKPTLLLTGARETHTRRMHAEALMAKIPDCQEVIFENSGHLSNLTESELFNQAVIDFCRRIENDATRLAGSALD